LELLKLLPENYKYSHKEVEEGLFIQIQIDPSLVNKTNVLFLFDIFVNSKFPIKAPKVCSMSNVNIIIRISLQVLL